MVNIKKNNDESNKNSSTGRKKHSDGAINNILMGLLLLGLAIWIFSVANLKNTLTLKEKKEEKVPEATTVIQVADEKETVIEETTVVIILETTSESSIDVTHEKEDYRTIKVRNIPEEYITLLELSEEEIKTQLITFANSYGFARAREIGSMGTITVNTNEDAVYAGFFYYLEDDSYFKFDLVYVRRTGKFEFKPW